MIDANWSYEYIELREHLTDSIKNFVFDPAILKEERETLIWITLLCMSRKAFEESREQEYTFKKFAAHVSKIVDTL